MLYKKAFLNKYIVTMAIRSILVLLFFIYFNEHTAIMMHIGRTQMQQQPPKLPTLNNNKTKKRSKVIMYN